MNTILQQRIEEAAKEIGKKFYFIGMNPNKAAYEAAIQMGNKILQNQWISVDEELPTEKRIIAKLSKSFCGKDNCYEILHHIAKEHIDLKHPDGYYDCCGENVPMSAITHWMQIPTLKGEKQ